MMTKKIAPSFIDWLGLCLTGGISFAYSVWGADFAEWNINFPFLDFPIFIGEITLGLCLVFLLLKGRRIKIKLGKWHYGLLLFTLIVVVKAISGYFKHGPLALRNAAMFYYLFFVPLGYYFYERDILKSKKIILGLYLGLILLCVVKAPTLYFLFPYYLGMLVLAHKSGVKSLKIISIPIIILLFLNSNLLNSSKGLFVAIVFVCLFLGLCLMYILFNKNIIKTIFFTMLMIFFSSVFAINFILSKNTIERLKVWTKFTNIKDEYQKIQLLLTEIGDKEYLPIKKEVKIFQENISSSALKDKERVEKEEGVKERKGEEDVCNILWRLLVWKDMLREIVYTKKILGEDFGKPFRSVTVETLNKNTGIGWDTGLEMVGWIEPHNSYLHMIYRFGIVAIAVIILIFSLFLKLLKIFLRQKDVTGILLCSVILYWLVLANFIVLLELPYFAIPIWSIFGMTLAYARKK